MASAAKRAALDISHHGWSIIRICQEVIGDQEMCLKWCENRGLLPTERICAEGHEMIPTDDETCYGQFKCSKEHASGKTEVFSRTRGTFFENKRVSPERIIIMIYCFIKDMSYKDCIIESSIDGVTTCKNTVAELYSFCRELITQHLLELFDHSSQVGGEKIAVEIEELVLDERKFHVGHIGEGTCILAIIERDTKLFALEVSHHQWNDRDLLKLIKKHVAKGSVVIPQHWRDCYSLLYEDGYTVKESNASSLSYQNTEEFDCPPVRMNLKKSIYKDLNVDKLLEYLYKLDVRKRNVDPFEAFLDVIRHRFPV